MKKYGGKVFFLDRDNINTDEIIPAKYLTEIEKTPLKSHLLEDLKMEGIEPSKVKWDEYGVVVSRANFGCGSSREMAVWAFEVNNINVIIASNFARIFRENSFNSGVLAIDLPLNIIDDLFKTFKDEKEVMADIQLNDRKVIFTTGKINKEIPFTLDKFQADVIAAGGWVELAAKKY